MMAKEVIELLEYLKSEPVVQGLFWLEAIGAVLAIAGVAVVFVYIIRQFRQMDKRARHLRNERRK